jgi:hypothetical protein
METLNAPAHYSDITEALNDSFEENVLDDRYVYNILNNNEDFFILLGEGVFSLTSWERTRQARPDPNLLFCPQPLPDLLGQTDTFFESILVAHQSLKMTPLASKFLDFMLKWSRQETTQSNWLKQSILSAYYLVGLIPYIFHFEGEDRAISSTLPNLELSDLRKYCLQKLTERLSAMPEFWWVIQKYHPARPVDLAEHFGEIRPSGLNDVTNRLKILAGLGAIQRLPHGRFRLTPFGIVVANQFARKSEFEDNEDKRDEIDEMDLGALDIGFW